MEQSRSERIGIIVIVLSLLFHILFLLLSATNYSLFDLLPTPVKKAISAPKPLQEEDDSIASMRPKMQPGAPVIWQEPTPPAPPAEPHQENQPMPEAPILKEEKPEEPSSFAKASKDKPAEALQEKIIERVLEPTSFVPEIPNAKEKTVEKIEPLPKKVAPTTPPTPKPQPQPAPKPAAKPAPKKLTLADISNDFFKKISQAADTTISIVGNDNKQIDASDLRQARYFEKIQECIKTSFNILRSHAPRQRPPSDKVELLIVLARRGGLDEVSLVTSSGSHAVDQFFMNAVSQAGKTFPPMPSFFKKDALPIHYLIYL